MLIESLSESWQKAFLTNANTSAFPSKVPTITEPINDGVLTLARESVLVQKQALILPYGLGSSNDAYSLRVLGWRLVAGSSLWVYTVLGEFACTLGAMVGIVGTPVVNTELFVDTITVVSEGTYTADVTRRGATRIYSPANDTIASLILPLNGAQKIEFVFDQTTNTPTMNCLVSFGHFD